MAAGSDLFNPATEEEGPGPSAKMLLPKLLPAGSAGREWLEQRRASIRPWSTFLDQRRFSRPRNLGELCKRLVGNVEYYQSNYVFVFLGLVLYCLITSPMLLVALAVFFGACYILYLRTLQSKLVLFGEAAPLSPCLSLPPALGPQDSDALPFAKSLFLGPSSPNCPHPDLQLAPVALLPSQPENHRPERALGGAIKGL
ncbi:prenylated Rab acceptor protein 1-like [Gracilinanus agilis]|uniref:prenylated Rab acceptor protein 1-like n=1 Tax=Gracilinanus agilis TaxID=191870 RepID=UPI001CFDB826|nr:prenylated Rab acceptor protein 1-like [Gracilinanus agilis]